MCPGTVGCAPLPKDARDIPETIMIAAAHTRSIETFLLLLLLPYADLKAFERDMTFMPLPEGSTERVRFTFSEPGLALMPVPSSPIIPSSFTVTTSPGYRPYGIYDNVPPVPAVTQIQYDTPGTSRKLFRFGTAETQELYFWVTALK